MSDQDKLLNQLLNEAPFAPTSEGLRDDILVAAMLDTTATHPASPLLKEQILKTAISSNSSNDVITFNRPSRHDPQHRSFFRRQVGNAVAGGLMAASLILGVWAGATGTADPFLAASFELAGLQSPEQDDNFEPYNVIDGFDPSENL